jgi:hypothetical protein
VELIVQSPSSLKTFLLFDAQPDNSSQAKNRKSLGIAKNNNTLIPANRNKIKLSFVDFQKVRNLEFITDLASNNERQVDIR